MNDLELLDRHGPDAPPVSDVTLAAARARLLSGMDSTAPAPRSRPALFRRGPMLAGLGLAAAVAVAAVAVPRPDARPDGRPDARPDAAPTAAPAITSSGPSSGAPPATSGIRLVAATAPGFPYTIPGLGDATFTADPGGPIIAVYLADDRSDVYLSTATEAPGFGGEPVDVEIDGRPGRLLPFDGTSDDGRPPLTLVWEHRDGVWLSLTGHRRYGTPEALVKLAGKVQDKPQRLRFEVTVGLIPDGWELAAFKDESILMYRDPADPQTGFQVQWTPGSRPLFRAAEVDGLEKASKVTVQGRPADLFRCRDFWMVQARLADRSIVRVMTPRTFTADQAVQLAESVRRS
ncbi:hypothetical protein Aph02nite_74310 [Actinoplanes philippinensis]|uniref:Uncharacterized protein n=1 Tax=Actinoplanes philippinensis TaxID=35752 RepID=A0A1I2K4L2_9ACTN|nr:hypothetical protein [Actinoplanes philippinensis]GIE81481.1 hypothetical protein Aph02nite_74310 [Actinoplanes philippinensis]SFF61844.1 hypothetical protein SAMN05421541_11590 [Actinoplanes philippinensis]